MPMDAHGCPSVSISIKFPSQKGLRKHPLLGGPLCQLPAWDVPLAAVWVMGHIMMSTHMSIKKEDKAQPSRTTPSPPPPPPHPPSTPRSLPHKPPPSHTTTPQRHPH